ncbi:MAG: SHD1 domain-containing protein [Planctomycetota bacterium]|nr:SHD1 domain-containing protein [Planctomycetota bacterium]
MNRFAVGVLACVLVVLSGSSAWAKSRLWTDSQGRTVQGEFVRYFEGKVVLKLKNGTAKSIPFENFSEADQKYLETLIDFEDEEEEEEQPAAANPEANKRPAGGGFPSGPPGINPASGLPPDRLPAFPRPIPRECPPARGCQRDRECL